MTPWRGGLLLAVALAAVALVMLQGPIAQPEAYHGFADQRRLFGMPNLMNVLSNLAFVLVGGAGLASVLRTPALPGGLHALRPAYATFFAGAVLIGLGSGYYHLEPDNARLVWDRLPMTLSFMALVAIIVGEHIDARWGRHLLLPLVLLGMTSVVYWWLTEQAGRGDLRPYLLVQFLPMLLLPLIMLLYRSRFAAMREMWGLIALYALAKFAELIDAALFALGGVLSGHTLKHLLAAAAMAMLLKALLVRRRRGDATSWDMAPGDGSGHTPGPA
jgi:hypothetical protein